MDKEQTAGGVITVFLSLVLPVILTVIATCLESARFEGLRLRSRMAADAAVQSVFAGYDRALYERYGLLFVSTAASPQREVEEIAKNYAILNTQAEGSSGFLSLKLIQTEAEGLHSAAESGGRIFLQAVGTYMQESGRMQAARSAAAEAGAGGFGQTKIALVEYLMRELSALTDEGAAGWQLEHCVTGAEGQSACLSEMEQRLYKVREERYLKHFRALAEDCPDVEEADGTDVEVPEPGEGSAGGTDPAPPPPTPEELAREAAMKDVRNLLNGGAVAEQADGSGRQLTYLQFVRSWLYRMDIGLLQRRAMEAIRDDLRSVEPDFDFSNCICSGTFSFCFRSDPVVPFSVFSRSYEFWYTAAYAY